MTSNQVLSLTSKDSKASLAPLAECYGEPLTNLEHNLWDLFANAAEAHPQHEAVVCLWQASPVTENHAPNRQGTTSIEGDQAINHQDPVPLRWSYSELRLRSESLAMWLQGQGCHAGMRLATVLWNSAEWTLCFWTAARLGMVFVPLDPRLMATDDAYLLDAADPAILVVQDSEEEASMQMHVPVALARIKLRISCSQRPSEGWTSLPPYPTTSTTSVSNDNLPSGETSGITTTTFDPDSPAVIVFTSGTTSTPKGCPQTARNIWAFTNDFDAETGRVERWLVHTPNSHVFAVQHALRAWRKGDAVVFPSRKFDVQATMRALVRERCTYMAAVPAIVKALLAQPDFPGKNALSLHYCALGSTLIGESDVRLCRDALGAKDAIQAFGMSEGGPITSWMRSDPLLREGYHDGAGKVLPGANMRICALNSRQPLARNQLGELHIGGAVVISGYLNGDDADKFYSDEIGKWVVTGDQGLIDDHGVLHITGRYKDIIIRGGENVAPVKIELVLSQIPGLHVSIVINQRSKYTDSLTRFDRPKLLVFQMKLLANFRSLLSLCRKAAPKLRC
jgi:acyl-CoA synthetase (AMP-forming)/AMP-acid ligase II